LGKNIEGKVAGVGGFEPPISRSDKLIVNHILLFTLIISNKKIIMMKDLE